MPLTKEQGGWYQIAVDRGWPFVAWPEVNVGKLYPNASHPLMVLQQRLTNDHTLVPYGSYVSCDQGMRFETQAYADAFARAVEAFNNRNEPPMRVFNAADCGELADRINTRISGLRAGGGWVISQATGIGTGMGDGWRLERLDGGPLADDDEAWRTVWRYARRGDSLHIAALSFLARFSPEEFVQVVQYVEAYYLVRKQKSRRESRKHYHAMRNLLINDYGISQPMARTELRRHITEVVQDTMAEVDVKALIVEAIEAQINKSLPTHQRTSVAKGIDKVIKDTVTSIVRERIVGVTIEMQPPPELRRRKRKVEGAET